MPQYQQIAVAASSPTAAPARAFGAGAALAYRMHVHDSPTSRRHRPVAAVLALAAAAALSRCGLASAQANAVPPQQPVPDYRTIIAGSLKAKDEYRDGSEGEIGYFRIRGGIFAAKARLDHVEVSDAVRMVQTNFHGWVWQTCLRLNLNGRPVTYAVFISDGRVVDARSAVAVDRCDRAHYAPLGGAAHR
jgi:hypothetical protein